MHCFLHSATTIDLALSAYDQIRTQARTAYLQIDPRDEFSFVTRQVAARVCNIYRCARPAQRNSGHKPFPIFLCIWLSQKEMGSGLELAIIVPRKHKPTAQLTRPQGTQR
jgi:hypothetical protein